MESDNQDTNNSNVSCFTLDGVVAEMVIDIDVEDSHQKSMKPSELPKLGEETSQQATPSPENLCVDLSSETDNKVSDATDSKKELISSRPQRNKLKSSASQKKDTVDKEKNSLKADEVKKSIFSELDLIRETSRLSGENKDETQNYSTLESKKEAPVTVKPAKEKKELDLKKNSKSESTLEEEGLENILPTSISTRGNKRKLADIENDNERSNKKKHTEARKDTKETKNLDLSSQTSSEGINLKSWTTATPILYNLFGKDSKFKNYLHINRAMNEVDLKFTRQLYRVLFDKWAPVDIAQTKNEILEFNGFPFDRCSEEVLKRKHTLNKLPDLSLKKICFILDLPRGKTEKMITSIIKFLHKPTKNVFCRVDPFQSCMQPFVKLDSLPLEYITLAGKEDEQPDDSSQQNKRGRPRQKKLGNKYLSKPVKKSPLQIRKPGRPPKKARALQNKTPHLIKKSPAIKNVPEASGTRDGKITEKTSNFDENLSVESRKKAQVQPEKSATIQKTKSKILRKGLKSQVEKKSILKSVQKKNMNRKIKKLKKEISELKVKVDETFMQAKSNAENGAILPSFGKEKDNVDNQSDSSFSTHQNVMNEDYSSEITLSAEENVEETRKEKQRKKKKKKMMRCGKPLRTFANIRDSIQNGNFSALQRLHILLFGASDKPENLKANILAFGGFPFLEGSDEWKQKEFLLSLLSLSTLKEYSTLLCIDHVGDDQQTVINKLMKFLAAPSGTIAEIEIIEDEPDLEMETHVVYSEPVQPIMIVDAKSIAPSPPKKTAVKKKEKPKGKGRNRKVLMSEAEVRRLEADIKREQRIRQREKKLNEELALKRRMSLIQNTSVGQTATTPTSIENVVSFQPISTVPMKTTSSTPGNQAVKKTLPKTPAKKASETPKKIPLPAMVKQADAEQLNALLQTVYKRRALKASGAIISSPKTKSSKLGELPNVKFLVVTANYSDLDVLHHVIYMTDAVKSKVRKNILDFSGFGFNEDSPLYKDRMEFLKSLGYDISKRIAFLLGLCPYKTTIDKQDLNELIMYFLMSPCKTKQVPITHLPQTFFSKNMPEELCVLMQKHSELEITPIPDTPGSNKEKAIEGPDSVINPSTSLESPVPVALSSGSDSPKPQPGPTKAKKSFSTSSKMITSFPIPFKDSASLFKPVAPRLKSSVDTSTYALQKAILKTGSLPEPVTSPQEFLVQQVTPDGKQKTYKLIKLPMDHPISSVIKPHIPLSSPPSSIIQASPAQTPKASSSATTLPVATTASIIQTPPLQIVSTPSMVQTSLNSTVTSTLSGPSGLIPPGIIIFKDKNNPPLAITSVPNNSLSTVPLIFGSPNQVILPQNIMALPSQPNTNLNFPSPVNITNVPAPAQTNRSKMSSAKDRAISSEPEAFGTPTQEGKTDSEMDGAASEVTPKSSTVASKSSAKPLSRKEIFGASKPAQERPPTNDELFKTIEKIILNADPEQITLRNVIDQVSEQYPDHNLKPRHIYMKDCVKKIILEST